MQSFFPEVLDMQESDKSVTIELRIPENLWFFDGHFKDRPVVPGYVLITWAVDFAARRWNGCQRPFHARALKFYWPIAPSQTISLRLEWPVPESGLNIEYSLSPEKKICCSGQVVFQ